ncbi:MAG: head decoration protein [Desulfobacteraceae bacterium]|nr:head decoration protein [Desulfobacteraceae bacterium]
MSIQSCRNHFTRAFILTGTPYAKETETILKDEGRTEPIKPYTVMAKHAASGKWTPFSDPAATDGTAIPQAVYLGDEIAAEAVTAEDVDGAPVLVGASCTLDKDQLIIENGQSLDTVIGSGIDQRTIEDHLATRGLYVEDTVGIDHYENSET